MIRPSSSIRWAALTGDGAITLLIASLGDIHSAGALPVGGRRIVAVDLPGAARLVDLLAEIQLALLQRQGVVAIRRHDLLEQATRFGNQLLGMPARSDLDLVKK